MSEQIVEDYVGVGQQALLGGGPPPEKQGTCFSRRVSGLYGVHVYAEHPDICACYYRVARRIMNVGMWRLLEGGLNEPQLAGEDLAPDPRYHPDNLFVRRLSLTVEYEETWNDNDALAAALMEAEAYLPAGGSVDLFHIDSGGAVTPI
jgi:hypothetical protein